jgi:hypothetical protein
MGCDMQFSGKNPTFRANLLHLDFYTLKKDASISTETVVPLQRYTLSHLRKQCFNLLKRIGYVMHQQFNIQQLYALPTLYLCVLHLCENKERLVPFTA